MLKYQNIENGDYEAALESNIKENKLKKEIASIKSGNKIFVSKDDIIDV